MVNMEHDTPVVEYKNPGEIRESSEITRLEKYFPENLYNPYP